MSSHGPCSCLPSPPRIITYHIGRLAFTQLHPSGTLHLGHSPHDVPRPVCSPTHPRLRCWPLLPPQLMQRGSNGSLQTEPGPDRHQTAGTVDQRRLMAVRHLIMCCYVSHSHRPHSRHSGYRFHHLHNLLHILLALSSSLYTSQSTLIIRYHHACTISSTP